MWRDLRGFSLKFYTSEGNYDMVGNDTPIFFVKDPMHFQNFIRSQKRLAKNNESPWFCRRPVLVDSDQGLVGPLCIVERGFELSRRDVGQIAV